MTLVELLVAMAIFTAIMGGVIVMFNSVTNTVRRSYRAMDMMETAQSTLMAIERDIETAFTARAAGLDFHFYGEPNGFVMIGTTRDDRLARLTYAVHRDTRRISAPGVPGWRGEIVTLPRVWSEMERRFNDLAMYYPEPAQPDNTIIEFEVEVVYGVLLRFFEKGEEEEDIEQIGLFAEMEPYLGRPDFSPAVFPDPEGRQEYPWFTRTVLQPYIDNVPTPWHVRDRLEMAERCHYWLQLLQGPGLAPVAPWNPLNIWWEDTNLEDIFWRDPVIGGNVTSPYLLWDYVLAEDFVIASYLLDPATGNRIEVYDEAGDRNVFVPFLSPSPIFEYTVESGASDKRFSPEFNTLFNLDHPLTVATDAPGAFELLTAALVAGSGDADEYVRAMTAPRQFYDMGNPLQSRLPSAFRISLWMMNPPVTPGAPPDIYRFSQTVHLPVGFLRRGRTPD